MTLPGVPAGPVRGQVRVSPVGPEAAETVVGIIHEAFSRRPALDPPSTALQETVDSVRATLQTDGGLLAHHGGVPVGAALLTAEGEALWLRRVAVLPQAQQLGVAQALAAAAEEFGISHGFRRLRVHARAELPATLRLWRRCGFHEASRTGTLLIMTKELPLTIPVPTAEDMRELGRRLAELVRAGDLVLLSGDLGAGKTTLTQGLGAGLRVRGEITSPTFVISRIHPSTHSGPPLVHVDAYRLGGLAELDDLDLDVSVADSVTVVEWGEGIAEDLADDRLEIVIHREKGAAQGAGERRTVQVRPVGRRWATDWATGALASLVT